MKRMTIDIETSGVTPECFIYQIAALVWEGTEIIDTFDERMVRNSVEYVDDNSTTEWWSTAVSDKVRAYVHSGTSDVVSTLNSLSNFLHKHKGCQIWSHSTFDIPILVHFASKNGVSLYFDYRSCLDIRTIERLFDPIGKHYMKLREGLQESTHNAMVDCCFQMRYVNKLAPVNEDKRIEIVDVNLLDDYGDSTLATWLMRYLSSLDLLKMGQPEMLRGALFIARHMHKAQSQDAWESAEASIKAGGQMTFEEYYNKNYNIQ